MSSLKQLAQALRVITADTRAVSGQLVGRARAIGSMAGAAQHVGAQASHDPAFRAVVVTLEAASKSVQQAALELARAAEAGERYAASLIGTRGADHQVLGSELGAPTPPSAAQTVLPSNLKPVLDASFAAPNGPGRFFVEAGDPFYERAAAMPPPPAGSFLAMIHGSPNAAGFGSQTLSPSELGQLILATPDYVPGQPVLLFSCSTGARSDGFAQQLANELGVSVTAPSTLAWLSEDGQVFVADPDGGRPPQPILWPDGRGGFSGNGRWLRFDPATAP